MNYDEMTNSEIISFFVEKIKNGENISVDDLRTALASRSIVDNVASADAITIFYSGETEQLIYNISSSESSNIRMIRRTEAFQLMAYADDETGNSFEKIIEYAIKCENPQLVGDELESKLLQTLYGVSEAGTDTSVRGEGFWTEISSRFAADTKGDAYSLCTNAREDRIFSRDELKNWLANVDDNAKMGGYTKAELLQMDETQRFQAI